MGASTVGTCVLVTIMTSQGHPHAIFRRAIERKNVMAAWATAHELRHLSLADALDLCLLVAEKEPGRYPRLALRWHARFCADSDRVTLQEAQAVLALLAAAQETSGARV